MSWLSRTIACLSAAVACASAVARAADDPGAAQDLFLHGRWEAARAAFESRVSASPGDVAANAFLADLANIRGDPDAALRYLARVGDKAGTDGHVQNALGDAYGLAALHASLFGRLELALKSKAAYERAVDLEPSNIDYRLSLMGYYRQAPGIAGGGMDKAYAAAGAIARINPLRGHLARASLLVDEGRFAEAFAEIRRALVLDPSDYGALYELGRAAALSGKRLDEGLAALRRCLELQPTTLSEEPQAAAAWRMGCILELKKRAEEARQAYRRALELDPSFSLASEALQRLPVPPSHG